MRLKPLGLAIVIATASVFPFQAAQAQNNQTVVESRPLKNLSLKRLKSQLKNCSKRGFMPTEVVASRKGKRTSFDLTLIKPPTPQPWRSEVELDDREFHRLHRELKSQQFRLVCHCEYAEKDKQLHVGIWHFDEKYKPVLDHGVLGKDPVPKPEGIPTLWNATTRIPESGTPVRGFERVDEVIKDLVRAHQLPGASIAISVDAKLVYARSFGYRDLDTLSVLRPTDVMRTFHCSRPLTSIAIMQLIEQGEIDLSTPVVEFLEIQLPKNADPNLKSITIDHLLDDIGGFNRLKTFDPIRNPEEVGKAIGSKDYFVTGQQIIDFMMTLPLSSIPGKEKSVSNFGFFLLGKVIEKASEMPYEQYVQQNILQPLKIDTMSIGKTLVGDRPANEVSYYGRSGTFTPLRVSQKHINRWVSQPNALSPELFEGAGGWIGTPSDLLTITHTVRTQRSPLLSQQALAAMFQKPDYVDLGRGTTEPATSYIASGWAVMGADRLQRTYIYGGHVGSSGILNYEGNGVGWALLCNNQATVMKTGISTAARRLKLNETIRSAVGR